MDLERKPEIENSKLETITPILDNSADKFPENKGDDLEEINLALQSEQKVIVDTTLKVNEIRHSLGLTGEDTDIPSISANKKKVEELELRLKQVLESDVSSKYKDIIEEVRKSKIDWAHSPELARRLKLRGADEQDLINIKKWLIDNATEAKTIILPPTKFRDLVEILHEMTGEENIKEGRAFHVSGGRDDVPEYIKNSVVMQENPSLPPLPDEEKKEGRINANILHHEFGHVTQSGLLEGGAYDDWNPKFKDNAPDPEYVGDIIETDTRIRSMYRDLDGLFDPEKEVFGRKHLEILEEKRKKGKLNKDTVDLLNHYGPIELVKLANRLPAI